MTASVVSIDGSALPKAETPICKCGRPMKIGAELFCGLGGRTAWYCPVGEDGRWWNIFFWGHTNPITISIP